MARIVVVGASQGGLQALRVLVGALPAEFAAPFLIVQHIGAAESLLPSILNDVDGSRAAFARNGEPLREGRIYVAPPDHHMLLNDGKLELTRGPRENWARPAVDPLFRTAAHYYGPDAIGVVLSGRLNDGTSGLYEIKRQGGIAIVQTPEEAEVSDMPESALHNVTVDYCLPVAEMPRLLTRLTGVPVKPPAAPPGGIRAEILEKRYTLTQKPIRALITCRWRESRTPAFERHKGQILERCPCSRSESEEHMSEAQYVLAAAHDRLRRARELVDSQEEYVARLKGLGGNAREQEELLVSFRTTLQQFEDHVRDLGRYSQPIDDGAN